MVAAAYVGVCLAIVVTEFALAHRGSAEATPRAKLTDQVMVLGTTAALLIGIALGLAGVALRSAAMSTLGDLYALTPQAGANLSIVTRGPYALIRHPGYAGILLSLLGLQLIAGTWVAVLALLLVILPLPIRIQIEEQLLIEQLGARYGEYERRTPYRLIPGIY